MQLLVQIKLEEPLSLPVNYNHILQAVIYRALNIMPDYASFFHDSGFTREQRHYKMFQFSQLMGKYRVENRKITFYSEVSFEIRSPEPLLIRLLAEDMWSRGITFGEKCYTDIRIGLSDYTVETSELLVRMKSPLTVYSTDNESGKTYYFGPDQSAFYELVQDNFYRKYQAYYGVAPDSVIQMEVCGDTMPKKLVTRYKESYVTAWYGTYRLSGRRKYLDFLYQTGLGSKNPQGFGMFEVL